MFKEIGLFKNKQVVGFALGAFIAGILRYFSHVISGVFIFGSADASYTAVAWSFLYNSFVFADLAIALVAGLMMFTSKAFVARLEVNVSVKKEKGASEQSLNAKTEQIDGEISNGDNNAEADNVSKTNIESVQKDTNAEQNSTNN